jgi:hypothetical protein
MDGLDHPDDEDRGDDEDDGHESGDERDRHAESRFLSPMLARVVRQVRPCLNLFTLDVGLILVSIDQGSPPYFTVAAVRRAFAN